MTNINIEELAETLQGSTLSLSTACEHCGYTEEDLTKEHHAELDSKVFECACCGWWCEISEANEVAGEFLCDDCNAEESDFG